MTRTELCDALRQAGVPDDLYALPGVHDALPGQESYYFVDRRGDQWLGGVRERGRDMPAGRFGAEDQACRWLYGELVFDAPAPATLDSAADRQARGRAETIVGELRDLLEQAARASGVRLTPYLLSEGTALDRFGQESGSLLFPYGTPLAQRSQPPSALTTSDPAYPHNYHRYLVVRPFRVRVGVVAAWFGQPGGGLQLKIDSGLLAEQPLLPTVLRLVRMGYLRRLSPH